MTDTQTCYFPDGTVVGDRPCHSSSIGDGSSACCDPVHMCLSNGLCLATYGMEAIYRGSCTDKTWQSLECAQYCSDVSISGAHAINLVDVDGERLFCCGNMNPFNNTCLNGTRGSFLPFSVEAGLVINNRTSGSTSTNNTDTTTVVITSTAPGNVAFTATTTATVTVTATAKAASSDPPSSSNASSSKSSSRGDAAIAAGLSSLLGLGLLIACSVLWKQRKQNQSLRKDVDEWKGKYSQSTKTKTVYVSGAEQQSPYQHDSRIFNELDEQSHLAAHRQNDRPSEIDGAQIYEAANRSRRA